MVGMVRLPLCLESGESMSMSDFYVKWKGEEIFEVQMT